MRPKATSGGEQPWKKREHDPINFILPPASDSNFYQTASAPASALVNWVDVGNKWLWDKMHINSSFSARFLMTAKNKFEIFFVPFWFAKEMDKKNEWIDAAFVRLIHI